MWAIGAVVAAVAVALVLAATSVRARNDPTAWVESLAVRENGTDAFRKLEGSTDPAVQQALIQGLAHPSHRVRQMCLRLLSRVEAPDAVAPIRKCLDEPDRFVRLQAARTLVQISDVGEILAEVVDPACPFARREVLTRSLAAEQVEGVNELLLNWLADDKQDLRVRAWATTLVGSETCLTEKERIQALAILTRLMADTHQVVDLREACAAALGRIGRKGAVGRLLGILGDPGQPPRLKEGAIEGLGRSADSHAYAVLVKILGDHSQPSSFRTRALEGIVCMASTTPAPGQAPPAAGTVLAILHEALTDSNRLVRLKSIVHLKCRVVPASLPYLRKAQLAETDDCGQRDLVEMVHILEQNTGSAQ